MRRSNYREFLDAATKFYGQDNIPDTVYRNEVNDIVGEFGIGFPNWFTNSQRYRVRYATYNLKLAFEDHGESKIEQADVPEDGRRRCPAAHRGSGG